MQLAQVLSKPKLVQDSVIGNIYNLLNNKVQFNSEITGTNVYSGWICLFITVYRVQLCIYKRKRV